MAPSAKEKPMGKEKENYTQRTTASCEDANSSNRLAKTQKPVGPWHYQQQIGICECLTKRVLGKENTEWNMEDMMVDCIKRKMKKAIEKENN